MVGSAITAHPLRRDTAVILWAMNDRSIPFLQTLFVGVVTLFVTSTHYKEETPSVLKKFSSDNAFADVLRSKLTEH